LAAGQPLSYFGTLGIISLSGISIINNVIVLIDQIDIEREKLPLREAVVAASQKRLRPILLTSATTVLGLAPMAIAGGALWQPMAVLMMSGLAVASLLTLFFVPAGYFLLFGSIRNPPAHPRVPARPANARPVRSADHRRLATKTPDRNAASSEPQGLLRVALLQMIRLGLSLGKFLR